jgi:signal transduction histidine kinase
MSGVLPAHEAVERRSLTAPLSRMRARHALAIAVLVGAYYGAAKLGYALEVAGPVAAIVWLPVGVGIASLYLGGLWLWPGVLIGDLLVNDYGVVPFGSALAQTCGNVLEVLVAVILLRRLVPFGSPLDTIEGIMRMLVALVAGTVLSATIGTLAQLFGDVIESDALPTVWRTWWLGDLSGALVIVPLAIAWRRPPPPGWLHGRRLEAALLLVTILAVSELASRTSRPVMYIVFPPLIWAALRFGQRGATLSVAIAVGFTVWNASQNVGPFVFDSISHMVVTTQLFIGVAALTTLFLAAVVSEREAFGEGLRASRARLLEASETERRRLLHNLHDGAQQRLTALVVHLRLAAERESPTREESAAALERAGNELMLAIEELRELAQGLHPALLARLGLAAAVKGVAARATVPVTLAELPEIRLDDAAEATAYYVVAEAVTNAQKHARATAITVRVGLRHEVLRVEVADNGIGGAFETNGSGLQGLRDRVEAIGGTFAVASGPGGTRVTARIPALAAA